MRDLERLFHAPGSTQEARELQSRLRRRVRVEPLGRSIGVVAGVDCAYPRGAAVGRAAVLTYRLDGLVPQDEAVVARPVAFPYIPGLLSFRELPLILAALAALPRMPDVILVDGQGIAHPRRLGLASHLGVLLGVPTIGCAKSVLIGRAAPPAQRSGAWTALIDRGETVGALLRTRPGTKPVVVSPGHRVDLNSSLALVMRCLDGRRIPRPLREADRLVGRRDAALART
ncbi:MAG TPA: deoxyribonuclease V [bacterium]